MDEKARKALEAMMKIPVSRGGMMEEFITEADLRRQCAVDQHPQNDETWEIICPICHTKYHLGVDSFITTLDDKLALLGGARSVVGNVNSMIIRADTIRKNGNDLTVARQAELNEETKQKIKKIQEDLRKGIDRKWFCRQCGGPENGANLYPVSA
jgi:hypothetical protein